MALARKPFVVIDAEILSSSVWSEAAHVRLVWITLLILCDTEGYVGASVPGIATAAGVTLDQAKDAIARLQEPDPESRTQANEGRRLERADRGWRVLNFIEHLDRLSSERARARERMRRHRARRKRNGDVTVTHGDVTVRSGNREQGVGNREVTEPSPSIQRAGEKGLGEEGAALAWIQKRGGVLKVRERIAKSGMLPSAWLADQKAPILALAIIGA